MSSCLSMMLADWIERAVEMDGVSYLKTPEEELSWIVLYNMDVYSALIFLVVVFVSVSTAVILHLLRVSTSLLTWSAATSGAMKKSA